ncbi:hypothetical protein D0U01_16730 [Burkholderia pseudomallei]|nr:hypothetical protein D0U01_16730 [Burkholderia pseudomallei]
MTQDSGLGTRDSGLRAQGSGLRTQDSGLRTQDSKFRAQGPIPQYSTQDPTPANCVLRRRAQACLRYRSAPLPANKSVRVATSRHTDRPARAIPWRCPARA